MAAATHRGPPKDDMPCLYCGEPKPKTDEHVVQKGLGGGAVLKHVVCGDCNTKVFSPLDKVLIQTVQELLCLQHPDLASGRTAFRWDFHYQYDEENGCWSTLRLDGAFRPRQMDQISIFPDGRVVVFLDPEQPGTPQARVDRLKEELAAPGALKLTRRIVAGKSPPVERAFIRSAANTYVLRGATETDIDDLQRIVEAGVFKTIREAEPVHSGRERPTVEGTITVDPFALQRACAKTPSPDPLRVT